ncbi:MAG: acetylxylan esterase [Candidatus Hydrogenedentes bacterium]|nr:acetylxylan esterase [Candidatus Hydrogenedentota bacterium]
MFFVLAIAMAAQPVTNDPFPGRYREDITASHGIRQDQFNQVHAYLDALKKEAADRRAEFFKPDYSSADAFAKSCEPLRKRVLERIGYPPPKTSPDKEPRVEKVAEDEYSTIYRMWLEVLEGVEGYSILTIPKGLAGPAPLMICQHGGGGSPEVIAPFTGDRGDGTFNYGWMVQRAVQRGYVTWAPELIFPVAGVEKIEGPDRLALDAGLRYVGTSLLAVELWKIHRGLDVVLRRPEIDPNRVAMMGLSYGGLYTLFATALESRIKVAVSSCYFNDRLRYSWADWSFHNYLNEFADPEIGALICPRPLMVEVGDKDALFVVDGARSQAPLARRHWEKLGLSSRFQYVEFDGAHEFKGERAYEFVDAALKAPVVSKP